MMRPWILLSVFIMALPTGAMAQPLHLRFEAYWGGLHAADFALTMADLSKPDETESTNVFRLQTRGFVDFLARMRLRAQSTGAVSDTPPFLTPQGYAVDYTSRRRDRIVKIDFSQPEARTSITDRKQGGKTLRAEDDVDDFAEADIKREELQGVMDPLLGLAEALRRTRAHLTGQGPARFTLRGFDGKRRFDMDGEVLSPASRTIAGTRHDTYRLRLTARPVAGFKARHRVLWDDSAFDLYVSRDGRFVPLQIVSLGHGPVLTLIEECPQACELPKPD